MAGNWDRVLSLHPDYNAFFIQQIGPERHAWLESLPLEDELEISGIRFRLVYGRFLDPMYEGEDADEKLMGGYAINTGSVGNNLGLARAHALLLEGEKGPGPLNISFLSVPYDNQKEAEKAGNWPDLPKKEAYQREITMGIYSRRK